MAVGSRRAHQHGEELRNGQLAVDQGRDADRVDGGDNGGFGRGEDAEPDTADDDDRKKQRPDPVFEGRAAFCLAGLVEDLDVFLADHEGPHQDQGCAHHEAGYDAADEQLGDRDVACHAHDDERQRRRNDRGDDAARCHEAHGRCLGVAGLAHHRIEDRHQGRRIGHGRAGEARQQDRGEDGHVSEPALAVPEVGGRKANDPCGEPAGRHDLAGHEEERDCQQREAVDAVQQRLGENIGGEQIHLHHQGHGAEQQGEGNRKSEHDAAQQHAEEQEEGHERSPSLEFASGSEATCSSGPTRCEIARMAISAPETTPAR